MARQLRHLLTNIQNSGIDESIVCRKKFLIAALSFDRFRTNAPFAFKKYRQMFEIDESEFLVSICSVPMIELSNPGASGSIFYITQDDKFICKTVQHKEAGVLQKLLPGWYYIVI